MSIDLKAVHTNATDNNAQYNSYSRLNINEEELQIQNKLKFPGNSFILALSNQITDGSKAYDCVLCFQNSILVTLEKIIEHGNSKEHLLKVMELICPKYGYLYSKRGSVQQILDVLNHHPTDIDKSGVSFSSPSAFLFTRIKILSRLSALHLEQASKCAVCAKRNLTVNIDKNAEIQSLSSTTKNVAYEACVNDVKGSSVMEIKPEKVISLNISDSIANEILIQNPEKFLNGPNRILKLAEDKATSKQTLDNKTTEILNFKPNKENIEGETHTEQLQTLGKLQTLPRNMVLTKPSTPASKTTGKTPATISIGKLNKMEKMDPNTSTGTKSSDENQVLNETQALFKTSNLIQLEPSKTKSEISGSNSTENSESDKSNEVEFINGKIKKIVWDENFNDDFKVQTENANIISGFNKSRYKFEKHNIKKCNVGIKQSMSESISQTPTVVSKFLSHKDEDVITCLDLDLKEYFYGEFSDTDLSDETKNLACDISYMNYPEDVKYSFECEQKHVTICSTDCLSFQNSRDVELRNLEETVNGNTAKENKMEQSIQESFFNKQINNFPEILLEDFKPRINSEDILMSDKYSVNLKGESSITNEEILNEHYTTSLTKLKGFNISTLVIPKQLLQVDAANSMLAFKKDITDHPAAHTLLNGSTMFSSELLEESLQVDTLNSDFKTKEIKITEEIPVSHIVSDGSTISSQVYEIDSELASKEAKITEGHQVPHSLPEPKKYDASNSIPEQLLQVDNVDLVLKSKEVNLTTEDNPVSDTLIEKNPVSHISSKASIIPSFKGLGKTIQVTTIISNLDLNKMDLTKANPLSLIEPERSVVSNLEVLDLSLQVIPGLTSKEESITKDHSVFHTVSEMSAVPKESLQVYNNLESNSKRVDVESTQIGTLTENKGVSLEYTNITKMDKHFSSNNKPGISPETPSAKTVDDSLDEKSKSCKSGTILHVSTDDSNKVKFTETLPNQDLNNRKEEHNEYGPIIIIASNHINRSLRCLLGFKSYTYWDLKFPLNWAQMEKNISNLPPVHSYLFVIVADITLITFESQMPVCFYGNCSWPITIYHINSSSHTKLMTDRLMYLRMLYEKLTYIPGINSKVVLTPLFPRKCLEFGKVFYNSTHQELHRITSHPFRPCFLAGDYNFINNQVIELKLRWFKFFQSIEFSKDNLSNYLYDMFFKLSNTCHPIDWISVYKLEFPFISQNLWMEEFLMANYYFKKSIIYANTAPIYQNLIQIPISNSYNDNISDEKDESFQQNEIQPENENFEMETETFPLESQTSNDNNNNYGIGVPVTANKNKDTAGHVYTVENANLNECKIVDLVDNTNSLKICVNVTKQIGNDTKEPMENLSREVTFGHKVLMKEMNENLDNQNIQVIDGSINSINCAGDQSGSGSKAIPIHNSISYNPNLGMMSFDRKFEENSNSKGKSIKAISRYPSSSQHKIRSISPFSKRLSVSPLLRSPCKRPRLGQRYFSQKHSRSSSSSASPDRLSETEKKKTYATGIRKSNGNSSRSQSKSPHFKLSCKKSIMPNKAKHEYYSSPLSERLPEMKKRRVNATEMNIGKIKSSLKQRFDQEDCITMSHVGKESDVVMKEQSTRPPRTDATTSVEVGEMSNEDQHKPINFTDRTGRLSILLEFATQCYDAPSLRKALGNALYEEFKVAEKETCLKLADEFDLYNKRPDLSPKYEKTNERLMKIYKSKYLNHSEKHMKMFWNEFWKIKLDIMEKDQLGIQILNLMDSFKQRIHSTTTTFPVVNKQGCKPDVNISSTSLSSVYFDKNIKGKSIPLLPSVSETMSSSRLSDIYSDSDSICDPPSPLVHNGSSCRAQDTVSFNCYDNLTRKVSKYHNQFPSMNTSQKIFGHCHSPSSITELSDKPLTRVMALDRGHSSHLKSKTSLTFDNLHKEIRPLVSSEFTTKIKDNRRKTHSKGKRGTRVSKNKNRHERFSFSKAVSDLEFIIPDIGNLGYAIKTIVNCLKGGLNSEESLNALTNSDNLIVMKLALMKIKSKYCKIGRKELYSCLKHSINSLIKYAKRKWKKNQKCTGYYRVVSEARTD